ncbi:hypothetical protein KSP40_PGU003208 [Platanthera guangdongensis]|uniref:Uncharacterized protein n=1 Tax=Platanthera guangdongensis TaxID=2320717 RepID=A0ABR2LWR0_9ASPA
MSTICGCSCSGGGCATIVTGVKPLFLSGLLKIHPLILTSARNEAAFLSKSWHKARPFVARASSVDSYENSSDFIKRTEQAWSISQAIRLVRTVCADSSTSYENLSPSSHSPPVDLLIDGGTSTVASLLQVAEFVLVASPNVALPVVVS